MSVGADIKGTSTCRKQGAFWCGLVTALLIPLQPRTSFLTLPLFCACHRRAEDERLRLLVEEERKKLLREAAELKDFLPRGIMRDQGDVDYIAQVGRASLCGWCCRRHLWEIWSPETYATGVHSRGHEKANETTQLEVLRSWLRIACYLSRICACDLPTICCTSFWCSLQVLEEMRLNRLKQQR